MSTAAAHAAPNLVHLFNDALAAARLEALAVLHAMLSPAPHDADPRLARERRLAAATILRTKPIEPEAMSPECQEAGHADTSSPDRQGGGHPTSRTPVTGTAHSAEPYLSSMTSNELLDLVAGTTVARGHDPAGPNRRPAHHAASTASAFLPSTVIPKSASGP